MSFSLVLCQKSVDDGLTRDEVIRMMDKLPEGVQFLPVDLEVNEDCAMGFITMEFADRLDYSYNVSGLTEFVADVFDRMDEGSREIACEFSGAKIWLTK